MRVAIIRIAQIKLQMLPSKTKIDPVKKVEVVTVVSEMNVIRSKTEMIKQPLNKFILLHLI
jgi:spore germination protein GerM